jgi:putative ABC transport system permease protein
MLRTTLRNLRARKLRLVTTSVAVMLGVAFMAGTLVLTDTIGRTFDSLFAEVNAGTDAYVRGETAFDSDVGAQRARLDTSLVATIGAVDGVAVAEPDIEGYAQLVDEDGEPMGNPAMGAPTLGGSWHADDDLNPFDLVDGHAPTADDQVVIDKRSATLGHFAVGDPATVLTPTGTQAVEIGGIATFGGADSPGGASYTAFTPSAAQTYLTEPGKVDAIKVVAADGVSDEQLVDRIAQVVPDGTEVLTGAQITAEDQQSLRDDMGFVNVFLLTFAVVALLVGSFIIYNSFSILVAQRTREMALLRAIGARRRQVLGSVLVEAAAVGAIASAAGLVAGIGVAIALKGLLDAMGIDLPAASIVVTSRTVIVATVAGLGVSVASAYFPARKAAKVPPVAALRDVAVDRSGSSRRRVVAGTAVTAVGAAAMAAGLFGGAGVGPVALGALAVFVGVAVLGPVLARPLSRVLGAPLPRLKGVAGNLARENAMRNPKRTSATASALMIGVALVGFITIMASSAKASVEAGIDDSFHGDLVVESGAFDAGGFSPDLAAELDALPETGAVSGLRMTSAEIDGAGGFVYGAEPAALGQIADLDVDQGSLDDLGATEIAVSSDVAERKGWTVGQDVPVRFAETGLQQLRIAALYDETGLVGEYLVGMAAYEANVADQLDQKVLVTFADGIDGADARSAVTTVADAYPQAEVQDRAEYKAAKGSKIDSIVNLMYALLALAVVIALLGIANTLALSIFERSRELGLLRAVGMTRRQLRAAVRYEAVVIALLGTTLGLVIGVGFGWAVVRALDEQGLGTFTLPVPQLAAMVVVAALAGVAAAILPARRAARLDVLEAITAP